MTQVCSICAHPACQAIEAARQQHRSYRLIAMDHGLAESTVRRHFRLHVAEIITPKKQPSTGRLTTEEHEGAQDLFLTDFAQYGIIRHALEASGVSRNTLHFWKETDETFMTRYRQAELSANDALREEARRRAVEGVESYVTSQGKVVYVENEKKELVALTERKYSDTLLIFEMKRRMPEYREKSALDVTSNGATVGQGVTLDQITELVHQAPNAVAEWKAERAYDDEDDLGSA